MEQKKGFVLWCSDKDFRESRRLFAPNVCAKCLRQMFAPNVCANCLRQMFAQKHFREADFPQAVLAMIVCTSV
jgi:ribosomal protein L28